MFDFTGKTVLVTGGSRGIGAAAVKLFARFGADVAFNYNKNYRLSEEVAAACEGYKGTVLFDECDVSDYQEVQGFVHKVISKLGKIDILVNNAGIWEYDRIDEMPVDHWRRTMQINLDSVYYFTHFVVKHMKEKNIRGNIVNISSTAGQRGEAFHSHYAATKGAIISFTKSLASELGDDRIRVNSVAPGWVNTDMSAAALAENKEQVLKDLSVGFIPEAEDMAGPIVFLASDYARAINGEILNVNGGNVLCG